MQKTKKEKKYTYHLARRPEQILPRPAFRREKTGRYVYQFSISVPEEDVRNILLPLLQMLAEPAVTHDGEVVLYRVPSVSSVVREALRLFLQKQKKKNGGEQK